MAARCRTQNEQQVFQLASLVVTRPNIMFSDTSFDLKIRDNTSDKSTKTTVDLRRHLAHITPATCRAQWLSRASDYRLREPGFESCAAVLKPWARVSTLHYSSSLSFINEYLTVVDMCTNSLRALIHCSIWLDASQRSRDGV